MLVAAPVACLLAALPVRSADPAAEAVARALRARAPQCPVEPHGADPAGEAASPSSERRSPPVLRRWPSWATRHRAFSSPRRPQRGWRSSARPTTSAPSGPAAPRPAVRRRFRRRRRDGRSDPPRWTAPLGGARPSGLCRPLVRESRQLHGRPRLDHGRRDGADHRLSGAGRVGGRAPAGAGAHRSGALRRSPSGLRPVQQARRAALPRRRRVPADRPRQGWLLLQLAAAGGLAAALLLPLYHLADATITLLRRLVRGERVWRRTGSLLPAGDRQRLLRARGQRPGPWPQPRPGGLAGATLLWPRPEFKPPALAMAADSSASCLAVRAVSPGSRARSGTIRMTGPLIALTGATGFIGRHLLQELPRRGYRLRVLLRPARGGAAGARRAPSSATSRGRRTWPPRCAASTRSSIRPASRTPCPGGRKTITAPSTPRRRSGSPGRPRRAGARRFVFLSSIRAQSGPSADRTLTEEDAPAPTDSYGRSKLAAEEGLAALGIDWVALRPVLVYGPGVQGNMAALVELARSPLPLPSAACAPGGRSWPSRTWPTPSTRCSARPHRSGGRSSWPIPSRSRSPT